MEGFMIQLGNMSMQAAAAVGAILIARLLFVRLGVSKKYAGLLWFIPYFCMICPWKLKSPFGLWESRPKEYQIERIRQAAIYIQGAASPVTAVGEAAKGAKTASHMTTVADSVSMVWTFGAICGSIWLVGILTILAYSVLSYIRLKRKLLCSIYQGENIYLADDIDVPFVFGLVRPKIYLPSGVGAEYLQYVTEHERTHIRRRDPVKKMLAFLITCIHWFNPFAWLAFLLLGKDMEMACDEETIEKIGADRKKEYANALLTLSTGRRILLGAPLAFGEGNAKGRIKNIMKYKRTLWAAATVAILIIIVLAACFFTRREEAGDKPAGMQTVPVADGVWGGENDMAVNLPHVIEASSKEPESTKLFADYNINDLSAKENAANNQAAHREGFQEAVLHFYIPKVEQEAGVSEDMLPPKEEREVLAQQALQELYDLTGTLIEECYYYSELGWSSYRFALTESDMDHSRVFFSRCYEDIQSMSLSSRRRVWYSPIDMFILPENYNKMSEEEKAVWFVTHAGNYNGKKVVETCQPYEWDKTVWHVIMEDDTAYELSLDSEVNSVGDIIGPYPDSNIEH